MAKKTINFPKGLTPTSERNGRYFFSKLEDSFDFPNLIEVQTKSYNEFLDKGIKELIAEINPIEDATGKKFRLEILKYEIEKPKHDIETCRRKALSYESVIRAHVALTNLVTGEIKEQDVYFGQLPHITEQGTFIVNGIERVIVSQIVRSPGIFFSKNSNVPGHFVGKMIPDRGAWLEVETDKRGVVWVKVDRKRKIPITMFLRAFGYKTNEEIVKLFEKDIPKDIELNPILKTLEKDESTTEEEAWQGVYKRIRPGDLATPENAKSFIHELFTNFRKYDLGVIARYKIDKRFGLTPRKVKKGDMDHRVFHIEDFVELIRELLKLNIHGGRVDDIDNLSNRRVRGVGELIQGRFRIGLLRAERIIRDRMSIVDMETVTPTQLVNCRPITAAMHEFFSSAQLSQFMDQTNPLSELEHKRRISAMGPGGLTRERASFEVRDVHPSHYGRLCPIMTPEGPNIGLVLHLAAYAKVNDYGFIETPYRIVKNTVKNKAKELIGRTAKEDIMDGKKTVAKKGDVFTKATAEKIEKIKGLTEVPVKAYVTSEIGYYEAEEEFNMCVAQANSEFNEMGEFVQSRVAARKAFVPGTYHVNEVTHIDVSPKQIISLSTSQIPFLENDDNVRTLVASNQQRQAVPLIRPDAPLVATGTETTTSQDQCTRAPEDGEIKSADAKQIVFIGKSGKKHTYDLQNFFRTNQSTCIHHSTRVESGQKVKQGDVLIDGASVKDGETALGQNLLVAYMPWKGYNFEDAIIISDRVVRDGTFNSIHINKYDIDVRDTKLGPEELTADIPNVAANKLQNLDEEGIVRIGTTVLAGDILAGKVTPKGETELTAEDRLLRAIFGEKAHDVKDSSLRIPRGSGGKVIHIEVLDRANGDDLPNGVLKRIEVHVAQMRHMEAGDKMAGRHGNKGVISKIVPMEDMPYMEDGTPVDIILNPLGVPSRMNLGQVLETHLGMAAREMGVKFATPALDGIKLGEIQELLKAANLPEDGKFQLYDGRTGEAFDHRTIVGVTYMLKLIHLVEDKVHARSVGPYSLVTQQPFGGKAQNGGQRFGEMEVWALEAYGAGHVLQEMLTIKSDDVRGRAKAYEAIVKGEEINLVSIPESFNVLVKELQSLGLKVELLQDGEVAYDRIPTSEEIGAAPSKGEDLINQSEDVTMVADGGIEEGAVGGVHVDTEGEEASATEEAPAEESAE